MRVKLAVVCIFIFTSLLCGIEKVTVIERWQHPEEIPGRIQYSLIDKDGAVVATFFKIGNRMVTPQKIIPITPFGQGPSEVMNVFAICRHKNGDLAIVEDPGRIKIFKKEHETYKWKQTVWLKRGLNAQAVHNSVFVDNRWFMAIFEILRIDKKEIDISFIKIYDEDGKPLKNLLTKTYPIEIMKKKNLIDMRRYILHHKDKVFFLTENELKVTLVSVKNLEVEKEVGLKRPEFYKKMPDDFFTRDKNKNPSRRSIDMENWLTSYSRITKAIVESGRLIIQIRTCSDKLKKFALLFYHADSFKHEKTLFVDDLLLGSKDGKLYCFGSGDPGLDEEIDQTVINIYKME